MAPGCSSGSPSIWHKHFSLKPPHIQCTHTHTHTHTQPHYPVLSQHCYSDWPLSLICMYCGIILSDNTRVQNNSLPYWCMLLRKPSFVKHCFQALKIPVICIHNCNLWPDSYSFAVSETRVGYKGRAEDCLFQNSTREAVVQDTLATSIGCWQYLLVINARSEWVLGLDILQAIHCLVSWTKSIFQHNIQKMYTCIQPHKKFSLRTSLYYRQWYNRTLLEGCLGDRMWIIDGSMQRELTEEDMSLPLRYNSIIMGMSLIISTNIFIIVKRDAWLRYYYTKSNNSWIPSVGSSTKVKSSSCKGGERLSKLYMSVGGRRVLLSNWSRLSQS